MDQMQNILKIILDGISKYESNHSIILYNVLAYLILNKHYLHNDYDSSYDCIYDKNKPDSFISSMKSKYNSRFFCQCSNPSSVDGSALL